MGLGLLFTYFWALGRDLGPEGVGCRVSGFESRLA